MANLNISTSQHLLKRLEDDMSKLNNLMSQVLIVSSNLEGTWIAISQTHKNWKSDTEDS